MFATFSDIINVPVPSKSGEDSVSFLPALKGEKIKSTRPGVIHHSISGHFGYRQGKWKLLLARGSGGWTYHKKMILLWILCLLLSYMIWKMMQQKQLTYI